MTWIVGGFIGGFAIGSMLFAVLGVQQYQKGYEDGQMLSEKR